MLISKFLTRCNLPVWEPPQHIDDGGGGDDDGGGGRGDGGDDDYDDDDDDYDGDGGYDYPHNLIK